MPLCLVDTSFLVALIDVTDRAHHACLAAASDVDMLLPDVMLTEAAYLLGKHEGQRAVDVLLNTLVSTQPPMVELMYEDLRRVQAIRQKFRSNNFDFVDCCIMAMAERLNVTHICTLDRRDFSVFRPAHCEYLTLLPETLP